MRIKLSNQGPFKIYTRTLRHREDWSVVNEVIISDCYKLKEINKVIEPPSVILDIGGHIGTFGMFAKYLWPSAKLIALEPNKDNYLLYVKNMEVNNFDNYFILNKGIGYDKKVNILLDGPEATGGCLLRNEDEAKEIQSNGRYKIIQTGVEVISIEDLVNQFNLQKFIFGKWDCEGAEIPAFHAMNKESREIFNILVGEYHMLKGDKITFLKEITPLFPKLFFEVRGEPNFPLGKFWAFNKEDYSRWTKSIS